MSLLIALTVSAVVYVGCFKNDFTKEHIDKAAPFMIIVSIIIFTLGALI